MSTVNNKFSNPLIYPPLPKPSSEKPPRPKQSGANSGKHASWQLGKPLEISVYADILIPSNTSVGYSSSRATPSRSDSTISTDGTTKHISGLKPPRGVSKGMRRSCSEGDKCDKVITGYGLIIKAPPTSGTHDGLIGFLIKKSVDSGVPVVSIGATESFDDIAITSNQWGYVLGIGNNRPYLFAIDLSSLLHSVSDYIETNIKRLVHEMKIAGCFPAGRVIVESKDEKAVRWLSYAEPAGRLGKPRFAFSKPSSRPRRGYIRQDLSFNIGKLNAYWVHMTGMKRGFIPVHQFMEGFGRHVLLQSTGNASPTVPWNNVFVYSQLQVEIGLSLINCLTYRGPLVKNNGATTVVTTLKRKNSTQSAAPTTSVVRKTSLMRSLGGFESDDGSMVSASCNVVQGLASHYLYMVQNTKVTIEDPSSKDQPTSNKHQASMNTNQLATCLNNYRNNTN